MHQEIKLWVGDPPQNCDICRGVIVGAFVDGVVGQSKRWACLCLHCHGKWGYGLGEGNGQRYERQLPTGLGGDGLHAKWVKVEG